MTTRHALSLAIALAAGIAMPAKAQDTIKIGELNSYKAVPAFLEPYKKGMELALEEVNAKGGVLGKKLELISRDDGANPGEAVRVAEELMTREGVVMISGTFLSNVGLAVTNGGVRIGNSMITNNSTGVSFTAGSLTSYKNNQIDGNLTPGTPIPQVNFN